MLAGHVHSPRPMRAVNDQRRLIDLHRSWPMRAIHDQCRLTDNACRKLTSLARYTHATSDACRSWLMMHVVGPTSPARCALATIDVPQPMCIYHGWCVQALADFACRRTMRASHDRCRPADAHRPRLIRACMLHVVG